MMATTLKLEKPWDDVKERLKENNLALTDDDLQYSPGQEDALLDRVSKKLKKTKEETKDWIESISSNKGRAS